MKLHCAYFEDGSVIECVCSQRAFKRHVALWRWGGAGRVWFRRSAWEAFRFGV